MYCFSKWLIDGEYTPYGYSYDVGRGTMKSILRYVDKQNVETCGGTTAQDNGSGSLMRIMPACLFCYEKNAAGDMTDQEAIRHIHQIGGLTHNHLRAKIACGLYYFMVKEILVKKASDDSVNSLKEILQEGIRKGMAFYEENLEDTRELDYYKRLRDLDVLSRCNEDKISSSGYVVDTIEAAIWSLITTSSFEEALLKAVNLANDADTVGAIAGGLAGLYYGYENIPQDWLAEIKRRDWIEELCMDM